MSDLERLKAVFESFGIEYSVTEENSLKSSLIVGLPNSKYIQLQIEEGCGYGGFCAEFYFDEFGKFIKHGVWE